MSLSVKSPTYLLVSALLFIALAGVSLAGADPVRLTFEGLGETSGRPCVERVSNYYNGGFGGGVCSATGHGPGPNWGVVFSSNALALIDADAGGNGNFGSEPSPDTVLFFNPTGPVYMNVAGGFSGTLATHYSAPFQPSVLRVYSGMNGTGALLGELFLPLTAVRGAPDPNGDYSPLVPVELSFSGRARSAEFGGIANNIVFDDVTIDLAAPVPEPGTFLLLGLGLIDLVRRSRHSGTR
jgi:hypothetical protein